MYRSIVNVLLIIVMPLVFIAVLSSAFNDLMKKYEEGSVKAGYVVEGDALTEEFKDALKTFSEEAGIELTQYDNGNPEDIIRNNDLCAVVVFDNDSYTVYQDSDSLEMAKIVEYFVNAFYENMMAYQTGIDAGSVNLTVEHPSYKPAINSTDYYGIVEVVYVLWCAIVCGAGIFISEKKYRITKKYQVTNLSAAQLYFAKLIPLACTVSIGAIITMTLTWLLYGVHWGKPILSAAIVIISTCAASAFGLMVYSIFNNVVATIMVVFTVVWFAGFYGGAFESYMYSTHPQSIKNISPLYHINRSLTELSCMGHSDYIPRAIIFCLGIITVCSIIAIVASLLRKRGKA
jgi:ABC-2 type transport system permease protein